MIAGLPAPTAVASPRIVIADDDPGSRALMRATLEREGCVVEEAADGPGAIRCVQTGRVPDLLIIDVDMPGPDGIAVTRRLRAGYSEAELPIIVVTGYGDVDTKVRGLDAGATDFVTKPYQPAELVARVRAALRTRAALDRLESVQGVLAALAAAVEAKDPTTEHHCSRLASVSLDLARRIGASAEVVEAIGYGAVLHDVGKIGVPEAVIRKRGPLDDAEWAEMRRHPIIGARIVEPLRLGRLVATIIRAHHERWDGGGYPDGLRHDAIPLGARIVTIVDAYDAMTHDRPYRKARSEDEARTELLAHAGSQFDPELVDEFLAYLTEPTHALHAAARLRVSDTVPTFTRGLLDSPWAG